VTPAHAILSASREGKEIGMSQNIRGKVVVITSASSELGEATARHLAAAGTKVVLGARRFNRLATLAKDLRLDESAIVQTDVTGREQRAINAARRCSSSLSFVRAAPLMATNWPSATKVCEMAIRARLIAGSNDRSAA
jgi:NADP-dependent 3-hydroxy acid dehydrogenase YdfG